MPEGNEISIAGMRFALVADSLLPSGKRAIMRDFAPTNASPTGLKRVAWNVWGPIGASVQSSANQLGTDFAQNLETRFPRRLFSAGELTDTPFDLPQYDTGNGFFTSDVYTANQFNFNAADVKFGGKAASGLNPDGTAAYPRFMDEQADSIFVHSANISSELKGIAAEAWTPDGFVAQHAVVEGAQSWQGKGRITQGNSWPVQTRTSVQPAGGHYESVTSDPNDPVFGGGPVYGDAEAVGSDRLWMVDAQNPNSSQMTYTLDALQNWAAPFAVGDSQVRSTGIGPFGPFTYFGKRSNLYSFTDQGKPAPLSRALIGHLSDENGLQWADPGWGWNYAITNIGLRAISNSGEDNPVGIGERMREFTGHNGKPTAVWAERGELWVAYQTTYFDSDDVEHHDTYIYRGVFSRIPRTQDEQGLNFGQGVYGSQTAQNGQPDFYPAHYWVDTPCNVIFSTNTTPNTTLLYGYTSGHLWRETIARDGRDDLFPRRRYSLGGGVWYGTMLDQDPNLLKTLRLVRIRVRNVNPCASWQVYVSFNYDERNNVDDSNVIWQAVGPELTEDGYYTLYPSKGVAQQVETPIDNIWGRTIKIKLVQRLEPDATSYLPNPRIDPPEVDGQVEVEYFERPQIIEEDTCVVQVTGTGWSNNTEIQRLQDLVSQETPQPVRVQLPGDLPNVSKWAIVKSVTNRKDLKSNEIEGIEVILQVWTDSD